MLIKDVKLLSMKKKLNSFLELLITEFTFNNLYQNRKTLKPAKVRVYNNKNT